MKPHHHIVTATPHLDLCRAAVIEPALGLAMDWVGLDPSTLLLIGEADGTRIIWVERAGLALDVRGEGTEVHDRADFRAQLGLRRPPVALDRRAVRGLWVTAGNDPAAALRALERLLRGGE